MLFLSDRSKIACTETDSDLTNRYLKWQSGLSKLHEKEIIKPSAVARVWGLRVEEGVQVAR
jgi:hypothetical protein